MSVMVCPFCKGLTNFTRVWDQEAIPPGSGFENATNLRLTAQRCDNEKCAMVIVAVVQNWAEFMRTWPESVGGKVFPDVPMHIAESAGEAYRCYSIGAYRGAVLLARSVVEATAKEKNIASGSLFEKIEKLETQGLIRPYVKEGAHEVRYLGNDMAHGDFTDPIDLAEAELTLALMDEVLNEVFQAPARVAAARAARLAKVTPTST